jgi:hypothetical protein
MVVLLPWAYNAIFGASVVALGVWLLVRVTAPRRD